MPFWNESDGPFLGDLTNAGFSPESIDSVICTHLHQDDVGWNTRFIVLSLVESPATSLPRDCRDGEDLDRAARARSVREAGVACDQGRVERFGERHIRGVVGREVVSQRPAPVHECGVPGPLYGKVDQVLDCLIGPRACDLARENQAAAHRHHLEVHEFWGSRL